MPFIRRPQISVLNCKECRWEFCIGLLHYAIHCALSCNCRLPLFLVRCPGMFVICLLTICHMPDSNGSLLFTVKPKAKENVRIAAMLVYILQKKLRLKVGYIKRYIIIHYNRTLYLLMQESPPPLKFTHPYCCY
jgi:hypothetical protein